ncbi:MAG: O-methyltransferase [Candidatus Rifleibacteriota bacterium]
MNKTWTKVDDFFCDSFALQDKALKQVLLNCEKEGLPQIQISACQGQFLHLLAKVQGAGRILEIGTLGGYSSIFLARALKENGVLYTIEALEKHSSVAAKNFEICGVSDKIKLINNDATQALYDLIDKGCEPFDLIFIDADKDNYPIYLELVLKLTRPGSVIVADNIVRDGELINKESQDPCVQGVRKYCQILSENKQTETTGIQTVGPKGYDGFTLTIVSRADN